MKTFPILTLIALLTACGCTLIAETSNEAACGGGGSIPVGVPEYDAGAKILDSAPMCRDWSDCPTPADPCTAPSCRAGVCDWSPVFDGNYCCDVKGNGVCLKGVCSR